jgi:DNA-nicking Smr family endonuclease
MARDPHPTFSAKNSFAVFFTPRALAGGGLNPLTPGTYAGVDRANAERLHRGQYPIDRRLDLHGMDRDAAFAALAQAIPDAAMQGKRCLLIITGKGHAGGGVLRQSLPAWLNAPGLREHVLAFDAAQPRHGGSGAFYLLLKRKRP